MKLETQETNHFELACGRIAVTYSSTSITGEPLFNYRDQDVNRSFTGDEIEYEKTSIGQLVTVTLETIPDLRVVRFSLILPPARVLPGSAGTPITVPGVRTTAHTSLIGPPLGPEKTYEVCELTGTTQFVQS